MKLHPAVVVWAAAGVAAIEPSILMKVRTLSLLFAAVLQLVPLARVAQSVAPSIAPGSAALFRVIISSVAALGAFDAVSGASTTIRSPNSATGTVGQAFSYRIIVGPRAANRFRAEPLPDGLFMDRSYILGTPITIGETRVRLTASDGGHSVSKWITIYVLPPDGATPPFFLEQPIDQSATVGETTTFLSSVQSETPLTLRWLFNGAEIPGATNAILAFLNEPAVFAGNYAVVAQNTHGATTSAVARLYERVPLVNADAVWKYSDAGKNLRAAWRKPAFKDGAWPTGVGPFGYGWGDETTLVSAGVNPLRPNITTYFRHAFVVADANAYGGFELTFQADDAAVVSLNGKELLRYNLPPKGPVAFRKMALVAREQSAQFEWSSTNIMQPLVITGTNVFAVEIHQAKTNGADMRFDFRFSGRKVGP